MSAPWCYSALGRFPSTQSKHIQSELRIWFNVFRDYKRAIRFWCCQSECGLNVCLGIFAPPEPYTPIIISASSAITNHHNPTYQNVFATQQHGLTVSWADSQNIRLHRRVHINDQVASGVRLKEGCVVVPVGPSPLLASCSVLFELWLVTCHV